MIVGVVLYFSQYNLKRFLNQWESETDNAVVPVLYNSTIYCPNNEINSFLEPEKRPLDIICVENGRVYFLDIIQNVATSSTLVQLQSVKTSGGDLKTHFSCTVPLAEYLHLAHMNTLLFNAPRKNYEYQYLDHKIYLKNDAELQCFDIETDTVYAVSEFPEALYTTFIEKDSITFYHQDGSVAAELTLDHMAEINSYAEQLLKFEKMRNLGEGLLDEFFQMTYSFNGKMYVVCRVASMSGFYSAGIIFQYDIETDTLSYVSHAFPAGRLLPAYSIVPFVE